MEKPRFKPPARTAKTAAPLCFIVDSSYKALGGAMTRFRSEVQHFAEKGHRVTVIYSSRSNEKATRTRIIDYFNIPHTQSYMLPIYQARLFFKCLRLHLSRKILVFVAHEPISLVPPAMLRFVGIPVKTVLVMHGPMATETAMRGHKAFALLLGLVDRVAFKLAGKIVAVSEYERDYALKSGAKPWKVTIIRNGIDFPESVEPSDFRQDMGIPQDRIVIGYLGSVAAYRGTEFLIQGFSIARSLTEALLALALVFREELDEEQKKTIKEFAKSASDEVYISKPRTDVFPVLSTFDIYASHFSKKIDGIGFSIMEAMGSGLPVVTGKDRITCKLLRDGVDAVLVDKENPEATAEAMKRLADDPSLRKRIGANAKKTAAREFSKQHMLKLCEAVYLSEEN